MLLSEVQFDQVWNKMIPEDRGMVHNLPCRCLLLRSMNVLILEGDTMIADPPLEEHGITMLDIKKMLTTARVTHKLTK